MCEFEFGRRAVFKSTANTEWQMKLPILLTFLCTSKA